MNVQEALNVFGLSDELTELAIRKAYKQAELKFYPDKNCENQLVVEMMKAINAAPDFLLATIDKINQYHCADESIRYPLQGRAGKRT